MKRLPHRSTPGTARQRERGSQLLELMIALTIITVGAMGFLFATQANLKASQELTTNDLVASSLMSALETLREADFETLHDTYAFTFLPNPSTAFTSSADVIGELEGLTGGQAEVLVTFYTDETTLPNVYGPVADLDGDGAMTTTDISGSYELLPVRLLLTFRGPRGTEIRRFYTLLGRDS